MTTHSPRLAVLGKLKTTALRLTYWAFGLCLDGIPLHAVANKSVVPYKVGIAPVR